MFLNNNKRTTKLIRKSRALRVVESAIQLELSSRTETEQEARSKSSCYNFETLSTQIFQCNCFFSAATGPPPGYSSRRDSSRQRQSQRVQILSGGVFLILPNFSQHTHETFIKFVLSKKATKIDEILTVDLTLTT